ncbi:hypothetical protein [Methanolobus psychrotolerans]|uniref:hypothetical protein n=1 Tax=Methanolobus psychrotolerans TaxID=1874706 RepID=UPI000B91739C|nr:hypothetical protein [Methanolobus psychrotolerans]
MTKNKNSEKTMYRRKVLKLLSKLVPDDLISSKPDDSISIQPDDLISSKPDDLISSKPDDSISSKPDGSILRSDIRKILDVDITKGSLHHVLDDMAEEKLIEQTKIPNPDGGNNLVTAKITEKGQGYLQCLVDFGIGKN